MGYEIFMGFPFGECIQCGKWCIFWRIYFSNLAACFLVFPLHQCHSNNCFIWCWKRNRKSKQNNDAGAYYKVEAVANGSATGPSSISESSATLSTGTNTLTLTKTGVSTTPTVSAGYISSATSSTATVALTASVTTKGATTYTPGTSDQPIASGTYLTGTQTISGDADLVAGNIKKDVTIFGVTGTYEGSGGGYVEVVDTTDAAGGTIRTITPAQGTPVIQSGKTVEITADQLFAELKSKYAVSVSIDLINE